MLLLSITAYSKRAQSHLVHRTFSYNEINMVNAHLILIGFRARIVNKT